MEWEGKSKSVPGSISSVGVVNLECLFLSRVASCGNTFAESRSGRDVEVELLKGVVVHICKMLSKWVLESEQCP